MTSEALEKLYQEIKRDTPVLAELSQELKRKIEREMTHDFVGTDCNLLTPDCEFIPQLYAKLLELQDDVFGGILEAGDGGDVKAYVRIVILDPFNPVNRVTLNDLASIEKSYNFHMDSVHRLKAMKSLHYDPHNPPIRVLKPRSYLMQHLGGRLINTLKMYADKTTQ